MRKYNVFGLGNALVDIVMEVDDSFLSDNQVEKGIMTLVDEKRQFDLLSKVTVDEEMMACGGSAANTIIAVSQLGGSSFYSFKVADDFHGKIYMDDLENGGVDFNATRAIAADEDITGKCLVMVSPDAQRTMNTFLGVTSHLSPAEIDEEALKASEYLYMEGYLVSSPAAREAMLKAIAIARDNNVKVAFTFSDPSMAQYFREGLHEVMDHKPDLLFCNEHEAMLFTESETLESAVEILRKQTDLLVITRGSDGSVIISGENKIEIDPVKTKAVDTNGAGDMYAGAFLYAVTNGFGLEKAGHLASACAAAVVSQYGPRLKEHRLREIAETILKTN